MSLSAERNRGWTVTFAGTGINLALGILYTWSVLRGEISNSIESGDGVFRWNLASVNDPYALCCLIFAFAMIPAGRIQDRFGPRATAGIGGLLVGVGFLWISQTTDYVAWLLGFGVLAGAGIGFGYSAATPPALKWFPPAKTGLIAGLVVSGFGLASVYIAPLATHLIASRGLSATMLVFGLAFLVVVVALSRLLVNPPGGHVPVGAISPVAPAIVPAGGVLNSRVVYPLWITFFIGAGTGLMVIGSIAGMAQKCLGTFAFVAVALLAVGNAAGRIVGGMISDRIGRSNTLLAMFSLQAVFMFAATAVVDSESTLASVVLLLSVGLGFTYGTNLSLFPAITKDLWGLKSFGANYGLLFTAWGLGGFVLSRMGQMIRAETGEFFYSFLIAGALLSIGVLILLPFRRQIG